MLRGRKITRAALILALALWASPALAQVDGEHYAPGAACPPGSTPGHAVTADWDTFFECNGSSQMQRGPYFFGASSDTCDSNHAGMIQWTGSVFQACNGSSWGNLVLGGTALSALTAATTTNSIDSSNWAQTWKWGTLSTQTALNLTTSSMTTGTLLSLQDTAIANTSTGKVLSISDTTIGPGYGVYSVMSGLGNTGYAGYFTNTDTGAASYGLYASTSSSSGYAGYFKGNTYVSGDINDANVSNCSTLGTDANGKLTCEGSLPLTYISKQTASNSASLQFTSLPTSYDTLFLNCAGIVPATTGTLFVLQYREGATPTWETANYYQGGYYSGSNGGGSFSSNAANSYITFYGNAAGTGTEAKASISNNGSSSLTKWTDFQASAQSSSDSAYYDNRGAATYTGDTNPITAIKVFFSSGNITSGTCSLYGVNNMGGGNAAISGLTGATAANNIDNSAWAQTWKWGTLSTQTALNLTTSSMTTGTLLSLTNAATGNNAGTVLSVTNSEANAASYGINVSSASTGAGYGVSSVMTGPGNTGYGGYFSNTATSGVNYGVYASNASASGYGGYFANTSTGYAGYFSGRVNITSSAQVGSTTASCAAGNAGAVQYTSGTLEACNGTSWIPIDGGVHFISTQTASNSASLQWTGLGSYNTYFLNCDGIVPATNSAVFGIQVGEGATPTWETGASYIGDFALVFSAGNTANNLSETGTQLNLTTALNDQSGGYTGYDASIKLWIGGLASSNVKQMTFLTTFDVVAPGGAYGGSGGGAYYGDMNPITALRVLMSSGNISVGTCSLYGMN